MPNRVKVDFKRLHVEDEFGVKHLALGSIASRIYPYITQPTGVTWSLLNCKMSPYPPWNYVYLRKMAAGETIVSFPFGVLNGLFSWGPPWCKMSGIFCGCSWLQWSPSLGFFVAWRGGSGSLPIIPQHPLPFANHEARSNGCPFFHEIWYILVSYYKNLVFGMVRWLQLMCIACIALKLWHTRDAQSAPVYALKVAGVWKVSVWSWDLHVARSHAPIVCQE